MIITRTINGIELDIDVSKPNELFFEEDFAKNLPSDGINDILTQIYNYNPSYFPGSMMIELTCKCNFGCKFCYINSSKFPSHYAEKRFDEIEKDLKYLIRKGLLSCTITGGECLIHPDFVKIYRFLKENGVIVIVLSNLSILKQEHIDIFKKFPPFKVDVSVYGIDNAAMQQITSQNKYNSDVVLNNVLKLKTEGINVHCKTPVNTLTKSECENIQTWCEENNIKYFSSPEIFENYDGQSMDMYSVEVNDIIDDRLDIAKEKHGNELTAFGQKTNFECKGGEYGFFISYDYKLRPCMPFYAVPDANYDISELGIETAFERMQQLIEKYKGTKLKGCSGCTAVNMCKECIITQLRYDEDDLMSKMKEICLENKKMLSSANGK